MDKLDTIEGANKAAIFLMSLGDDAAAAVLQHFEPSQVQMVSEAMARLGKVTRSNLGEVITDFRQSVKDQTSLGIRGPEFAHRMLTSTLGETEAGLVMNRIRPAAQAKPLGKLQWIEAKEIIELVQDEPPQLIATILALMAPNEAAKVLAELPEETSSETVIRLAKLEVIPPDAINELESILNYSLSEPTAVKGNPIELSGPKQTAGIVNELDSELEEKMMEALKEKDNELAEQVEELMLVFENLMDLDDRGFQALLREIPNDLLVPSLKGTDAALRERFLNNMSKRAAEMLRDDMEVSGPIRISDVEEAQKEILMAARRLAEAGTISLGSKGGDEFV